MSDAARALVLVAGLGAAACNAVPVRTDEPRETAPGARGADELMRAGDYDAAVRVMESERSDSPVAKEKLLNAKTRAASAHANAATRAARDGDAERARAELVRAEAFLPDLPAVRSARESVEGLVADSQKATRLREEARDLVATNPEEAERLLAEAQAIQPDSTDTAMGTVRLRREATLRAEADRSADRAADAWSVGDRERVVRELAGAKFAGRPVAKADALLRRIETELTASTSPRDEAALRGAMEFATAAGLHPSVVSTLRDRLVDRLLAAARDLDATRRPATAALLETEARRLRGDARTPALDKVREIATVTILVEPFEDATGGRVDGMRLARAVRERLALDALGGGQALRALDDSADARAANRDALVLSGRVLTARESAGRTGRENRAVKYKSGTRRSANPEFEALVTQIDAASADVRKAEIEKQDAMAFLNSIRSLAFQPGDGTPRIGDVEYRTRLAAAEARANRADEALKRASDKEFTLRQQSGTVPREIEVPVYDEHLLTVTNSTKTSQITAHLDLVAGDESLLSQDVTAAAVHKETTADAFAPAGLAADPDETPDDATMAARAADRFAGIASGRVRAAAEAGSRRLLVAARAAEREGRRDEACENYSLYLLSTPDAASPERADAARALAELAGVHVAMRTGKAKEEE